MQVPTLWTPFFQLGFRNDCSCCFRSDVNKPNGVTVVAPSFDECKRFIQSMPTRRVPGIGRVLEKILRDALGCSSVADIYSKRAEILALFSASSSSFLITRSVGCGEVCHAPLALPGTAGGRQSYSQERESVCVLLTASVVNVYSRHVGRL
jgi:hypothetical protein